MARKPKQDQLSVVGLVSAILRNASQQRSLARSRARRNARLEARADPEAKKKEKKNKPKKPKDTRTREQIGVQVDATRAKLVDTVDGVKYDLDVPARLSDARDRVAASMPREWRGEPRATIAAVVVLLTGWGAIAWAAVSGSRRPR